MKNLYPRFQESYTQDELIEHFWLTNDEIVFLKTFRSEVNQQAAAVLLKTLNYLGFFPDNFGEVPESVRTFIARGLNSLWDVTNQYDWLSSAKDRHYSQIREFSGWRSATGEDRENLSQWLEENTAGEIGSEEALSETAVRRFQHLRIELPSRKELERLTSTVWNNVFQTIYRNIDEKLNSEQKQKLDELLIVKDTESFSAFDKLKSLSGKAGVENFSKEADKLKRIKEITFPAELSGKIPLKLLRILSRRATNEKAGEMKTHPAQIRDALLICFLLTRKAEITDNLGQMFLEILQKLERGSEKEVDREIVSDFKRVDGKPQILYRVACAVTENPNGNVSDVIFKTVKEEVFQNIIVEHEAGGSFYRTRQRYFLKNKYVRHYQRILPVMLENLDFRSGNPQQPIVKALKIIKKYVGTNFQHFPEAVPTEIVTPSWKTTVFEEEGGELKVNRKGYELCVLHKLEKALKCKEVWVEGAKIFRNPQEDLPGDWEAKRLHYYEMLSQNRKPKNSSPV